MKRNPRFVFIISVVFVTSYIINVNSSEILPSSDLKTQTATFPNTLDPKNDSTHRSNGEENLSNTQSSDSTPNSDGPSRPNFLQMFEKFTDPLTKEFPPNFRRNYAYFLLLYAFLAVYAFFGYRRNKSFAKKLASAAEPVLEDHFAYVERDPNLLDKKGLSQFEMYASGRTSCRGLLIKLDLLKRQCFWHETFIRLFQPQFDIVNFDVLFESLDNFMFAVCTKTKNKSFIDSYPHLLVFTNVHEFKDLPDTLRAYLDSNDKSVVQFASYILHQFTPFMSNLVHLYVSDVDSTDTTLNKRPRLQCRFKLTKNTEDFEKLTKAVIHVADCAKNFSLSPKIRENILKDRSELELAYNRLNRANRDDMNDGDSELSSEKVKKYEERMARKNKPVTNIKIRKIK